MKAFIERIEMFPEKRKDGSWIKKIVFNFPVPVDGEEVKELPLETETTVETVCLLSKLHEAKHHVNVRLDMDELDLTSAESKATYEEIKAYVAEHNDGMKVSNLYIAQLGKTYALLNQMRTAVRETEVAAATAFHNGKSYDRGDIIEELNRMSSAMHILMCKQLAKLQNQETK